MIELRNERDITEKDTKLVELKTIGNPLQGTDFEKYLEMKNNGFFVDYGVVKDSTIIYDGEEIPTKEIVYNGSEGYDAVVIFCASDESYITTEVRKQ